MSALTDNLFLVAGAIEKKLDTILTINPPHGADDLYKAIRYSALSQSKKLRGFLLIKTSNMFKVDPDHSLTMAAIIEMIHTYSLIHDDLPAMDNDDYRRGQFSCHKQFNEGIAILAGNALLTHAIALIASNAMQIQDNLKTMIIREITSAIGLEGMLGGQAIDIAQSDMNFDDIMKLYSLKTGALLSISCTCGAILGSASDKQLYHLKNYAHKLGLIFQIADDIDDYDKDIQSNSKNILRVLSKDEVSNVVKKIYMEALEHLAKVDQDTSELLALLNFQAQQLQL